MLDLVYTSAPPQYELWDGIVDPASPHPYLVVPPRIYSQSITLIIGLFARAGTTENAEATYSLISVIDRYTWQGPVVIRWDFDAATGAQIGKQEYIPSILVQARINQSPSGQLYNNDQQTGATFPIDPNTLAANGAGYLWSYWHDGATDALVAYAILIDPLAGLAVAKTNLNSNSEVSVHRLSDGETVRRIPVAGLVHSIAAESPGTCYVVATNGVVSVVDYVSGQVLGVFRMTGQASLWSFKIAWDPVYRRALLFEDEDDATDGACVSRIRGYRPVPIPVAITRPLPIVAPRLGRTVPVIVRAYGDAGEGISGYRIGAVETGSGTLLSAAEPTDELGYATFRERCDATGSSLVEAFTFGSPPAPTDPIPPSPPGPPPPPPSPPPSPPPGGGIKTLFPRLGRYSISAPHSYGSASSQAQLARVDIVILGFNLGWGSASAMNAAVNAMKAINPALKVLTYCVLMEVSPTAAGQLPFRNKLNAEGWWLYPTGTSGSPVPALGSALSTNITNFVPSDGAGKKWNTWFAEYWNDHVWSLITNLDGVFTDNVFWKPRRTGDWNRDGTSDSENNPTVQGWWRTGTMAHLNHIRSIFPGALVLGNIGDWRQAIGALPEYQDQLDGGILEGYIGNSWSPEGIDFNGVNNGWGSWALMMAGYRKVKAYAGTNKILIFDHVCKPTDYKGFRYGFASCLMDDAYYDFSDPTVGSIYGQYVRWFDEYDLNGTADTAWLGTAVDVPPTSPWQNGVYRRRFTGGMALVNPRGNGPQTVTLESGYKRFVGSQDPATNNGTTAISVTIPDRDGLLLVKV